MPNTIIHSYIHAIGYWFFTSAIDSDLFNNSHGATTNDSRNPEHLTKISGLSLSVWLISLCYIATRYYPTPCCKLTVIHPIGFWLSTNAMIKIPIPSNEELSSGKYGRFHHGSWMKFDNLYWIKEQLAEYGTLNQRILGTKTCWVLRSPWF